jgi:alpha-glucosidase (family GH31 glycosyl hydrolase)
MPLYVRAGAVLPLGPVRQYADEPVDEPLTLIIYPGASGASFLYDDDGISFDHRTGDFMRLVMAWDDASRRLTLSLAPGSRMRPPALRRIDIRLAGQSTALPVSFTGEPLVVEL